MHNATLSLALIVGGAALAALGVLRVAGTSFGSMPRAVAAFVVVVGAGVVAFGALLPSLQGPPAVALDHSLPLRQQPSGATPEPLLSTDIRGVVRDARGQPVGGVPVVLSMLGDSGAPTNATSASDGTFTFDHVSVSGPVVLAASYSGTTFEAQPTGSLSDVVEIRVALTTTDNSTLSIRASSLAVVGDAKGVQAVHAMTIHNTGDHAFVGALRLPLLPGATEVQPGLGLSRSKLEAPPSADELESTTPILPGDTQITYTYLAPMNAHGVGYAQTTAIAVRRFDLLLGGRLAPGPHAPSARAGTTTIGGRTYRRLSWRNLGSASTVRARIQLASGSRALRVGLIAAAAAAAAAIVLSPIARRRRVAPAPSPAAPSE